MACSLQSNNHHSEYVLWRCGALTAVEAKELPTLRVTTANKRYCTSGAKKKCAREVARPKNGNMNTFSRFFLSSSLSFLLRGFVSAAYGSHLSTFRVSNQCNAKKTNEEKTNGECKSEKVQRELFFVVVMVAVLRIKVPRSRITCERIPSVIFHTYEHWALSTRAMYANLVHVTYHCSGEETKRARIYEIIRYSVAIVKVSKTF